MCNNKGFQCLSQSDNNLFDNLHHHTQQHHYLMDSPTAVRSPATGGSDPGSNDETRRVKFLCSFLGSIIPRPQDGRLRYVGGETRIVSVPHDISYEELMMKMRELYDGAAVLKYQQPDEDLDALVSVVNDDDVVNMMEEYDKLGSGDGFTRLRIFLFSQLEQDGSSHFNDGDDNERRYVDALNILNDVSDFRMLNQMEFPIMNPVEDIHMPDQLYNPISVEGGIYSQRSGELSMPPQYNLHHIAIQHQQQPMSQRFSEMDSPWSPAFYSPRHHAHHDSRSVVEFPSSPSSARYRGPFPELPDYGVPEEYARHHVYDNQPQYPENVVWMPTAPPPHCEKSGFPGNSFHGPNVVDGNSICDHCRMSFPRGQPSMELPNNISNGLPPVVGNSCAECPSTTVNAIYPNEPSNDLVINLSRHGSVNDGHTYLSRHGSVNDSHTLSANYVQQPPGPELGAELFPDQTMPAIAHIQIPALEEHSIRFGNPPSPYAVDSHFAVPRGHVPGHAFWRNAPTPVHIGPSYEVSTSSQQVNGMINAGLVRVESNPGFFVGPDSQNPIPLVDSPLMLSGHDGLAISEHPYTQTLKMSSNAIDQENQHPITVDAIYPSQDINASTFLEPMQLPKSSVNMVHGNVENYNAQPHVISFSEQNKITENVFKAVSQPAAECGNVEKLADKDPSAPEDSKHLVDQFSFLPELIASVKKAALEGAEEVRAKAEEHENSQMHNSKPKEETANEVELVNAHDDLESEPENDHVDTSKIEPTKAEEEAIARGLQTIKNDDLEEIRELGSGTYGAVYHGKWKGSDVAIKRIKASCFAGRPSERERLIADFWKEALLLSSLHHPNVVSFYGIVRDGPDGSLATVTEFMVNGSLKQFLHKKDRTIDRRKRLIIAMDAAFGMEYLHAKNIVHFDLKCENLLVNMRDPQRPVCKIGDLGLSKVKQHTLVSGGVRGTLPWMAPELLSGKSTMVSEKIDVYSFGIVMWEVLTGDEPYANMHCASIIGGIVNGSLRPQTPTWCDPEWKSLMESCWASDPAERPSFSEISKKLRTMAAAMNVK
ncbi:PREDICTED: uncharacterized protein LOC109362248 [Lupinus angustifolius]|nr:PREDICTED: uncharacterized protein LOC109362248 [Lupinus angustifolius]XP_019463448.1 PREDICTED: uncharacterized protein LOC109362248 [Lupinus angustifolius]XP_019463449.1 PREDICTED: uncharacterized protein LOC109362248 [Lupinus angustifolius]XP_019463450.1 PREDICTED: uncharacterized protein LOC109362248 [Lupinus angustifolius]XP_019463451.1 PREDICTED: uncharacterized protein LOC109362248 [Lupinus angustifolius]XP_019463452.1 PREDICTED: uncharacterized protein LOC109362248 [Lupinus angustif